MATEGAELKRAAAAVVGVAESDLGLVPQHTTPTDLMAQAAVRAAADSGLRLSDIDAIRCAHSTRR